MYATVKRPHYRLALSDCRIYLSCSTQCEDLLILEERRNKIPSLHLFPSLSLQRFLSFLLMSPSVRRSIEVWNWKTHSVQMRQWQSKFKNSLLVKCSSRQTILPSFNISSLELQRKLKFPLSQYIQSMGFILENTWASILANVYWLFFVVLHVLVISSSLELSVVTIELHKGMSILFPYPQWS